MNTNIAELLVNDAPLYAVADALLEINLNYNQKLYNKHTANDFLFKSKSRYLNSLGIKNFIKKCKYYVGSNIQNKYICLQLVDIVKIAIWYHITENNQNLFKAMIRRNKDERQSAYKERMAELIKIFHHFKLPLLEKEAISAQWQSSYQKDY